MHNLQSKLQLAFSDAMDCFDFFDLKNSETIKIEEFIFGIEFFLKGDRLAECTCLFQHLDAKSRDKQLDLVEFSQLMPAWAL